LEFTIEYTTYYDDSKVKDLTYQSFLSFTLNIWRTIFLLDKHIGNSRAGLNEEQTSSQDHTHASIIRKIFTTSLR
jgi:hypothetical protein